MTIELYKTAYDEMKSMLVAKPIILQCNLMVMKWHVHGQVA